MKGELVWEAEWDAIEPTPESEEFNSVYLEMLRDFFIGRLFWSTSLPETMVKIFYLEEESGDPCLS